ncbi:hypothetical protein A2U01_0110566, partial [Trifolium medium]|nr:hypothetical protein [Trifolium medium]
LAYQPFALPSDQAEFRCSQLRNHCFSGVVATVASVVGAVDSDSSSVASAAAASP